MRSGTRPVTPPLGPDQFIKPGVQPPSLGALLAASTIRKNWRQSRKRKEKKASRIFRETAKDADAKQVAVRAAGTAAARAAASAARRKKKNGGRKKTRKKRRKRRKRRNRRSVRKGGSRSSARRKTRRSRRSAHKKTRRNRRSAHKKTRRKRGGEGGDADAEGYNGDNESDQSGMLNLSDWLYFHPHSERVPDKGRQNSPTMDAQRVKDAEWARKHGVAFPVPQAQIEGVL